MVCLFSATFKRDLLCFLHHLHPGLPQENVLALLRCLSHDADDNPWVSALISQLHKDLGVDVFGEGTLLTPECVLNLKELCDRFKDCQEKGEWDLCLNEHKTDELYTESQTDAGSKKRKSEITDVHMGEEVDEPRSKRRRTDLVTQGDLEDRQVAVGQEGAEVKPLRLDEELEGDSTVALPVPEDCLSILPDHIKVKWKCAQIIKIFNILFLK